MSSLSALKRSENLSQLANEPFDVLVIGGGVTGAGVALDAATRGYSVALVEKNDFASGTSSRSTKLVHGGIRYLPNFDFALVYEALTERGLLLQNAPFLVQPLAFVLPIYEGDRHPVGIPFTTPGGIGLSSILNIGLWLYDLMAGKYTIRRHRHISRTEVLKQAPTLLSQGLKEGFIYYDGQTNDTRLTMTLLRTAASYGATIVNYAEVTSFLMENDKVQGVRVSDSLQGEEISIRARHIVNATGVFAEQMEELTGVEPQVQVEPSKGVHLVFSREKLPIGDSAIVLPETDDKRILFIVPWESRVIFGTTDTGSGDLNHPSATSEDISYLLHHLNHYLSVKLSEDDIITTYAGYRPLLKSRNAPRSNASLSRTHAVLQSPSGLVTIVGGKLTTYRRMAQDTVDVLVRRDQKAVSHPTQRLTLQGSDHWSTVRESLQQQSKTLGLDDEIIHHLGKSYGGEAQHILDSIATEPTLGTRLLADLPYIGAEVLYACRYEMAMKPEDFLARRTAITLLDRQKGLNVVEQLVTLMSRELSWSAHQQQAMITSCQNFLQRGNVLMQER